MHNPSKVDTIKSEVTTSILYSYVAGNLHVSGVARGIHLGIVPYWGLGGTYCPVQQGVSGLCITLNWNFVRAVGITNTVARLWIPHAVYSSCHSLLVKDD